MIFMHSERCNWIVNFFFQIYHKDNLLRKEMNCQIPLQVLEFWLCKIEIDQMKKYKDWNSEVFKENVWR